MAESFSREKLRLNLVLLLAGFPISASVSSGQLPTDAFHESTDTAGPVVLKLRTVAPSNYTDGVSAPPGDSRPTPREILSEIFLATPASTSATSALFVGWGLLVSYDLVRTEGNGSEPFDILCNDAALADVWCPLGSLSEPIPFNRSRSEIDAAGDGARSPINYATAYLDLDWLYGRDEDSADEIRTFESGRLNLTDDRLPHHLAGDVWLLADQRPATMPVTFALTTLLLREHNKCCDEYAPDWGATTDQEAYEYCRQWTIATYQRITEYDFSIRLVGGNIKNLGAEKYGGDGSYDNQTDGGVDVVFSTVALPAFYSAIPSTVGLLDENFDSMDEHGIELAKASADVAGLVKRNGGIEPIIRGAAYSRTQKVDASFVAEVSASSPLFNFPVESVQRGRDHGVPSYNDVREAYRLGRVTTFAEITPDETVQEILSAAYGDIDMVDAFTGAVAEAEEGSTLFAGPLLRSIFLEQLYRLIVGDRHHYERNAQNEDVSPGTLYELIVNNSLVSSIQLNIFTAPELVALDSCHESANAVTLSEGCKLAWNESTYDDMIYLTLTARDIGTEGMVGIGFGGNEMTTTNDYVICEVKSAYNATCTDRSGSGGRSKPPLDEEGDSNELSVVSISFAGDWTSVTFARPWAGNDDSDYSLAKDFETGDDTPIIYAWGAGSGIMQHTNSQRGASSVNFMNGSVIAVCDESNHYFALHGALLLAVWMTIAPFGLYYARYRKGKKAILGIMWWEMHRECMVTCAEALLPLAIAAMFTTNGPHNSAHAQWGFYMIAAVSLQLVTGWARSRALQAKANNFSVIQRVNKYFHIYSGWVAYFAGLVQCYRGLELISGSERLMFEGYDIGFTFANFDVVDKYIFPLWLAIVAPFFIVLEVHKQFRRFITKGAANVCGVVEVVNESFIVDGIEAKMKDRLMPRTEELPIYSTEEFNDKILNGRSWVIVDGAILNVSSFARRHPGGARLIMNALGTDVTSEIIGEDASTGIFKMAFTPHSHTDTALEIARSLVVGYIEEDDALYSTSEDCGATSVDYASSASAGAGYSKEISQSCSDSVDDEKLPRGSILRSFSIARSQRKWVARSSRHGSRSSDDEMREHARAMPNSLADERRRTTSGVREEKRSSSGTRYSRSKSLGGKTKSTRTVGPMVGSRMKLSEKAEAIINAASPPTAGIPVAREDTPAKSEGNDGNDEAVKVDIAPRTATAATDNSEAGTSVMSTKEPVTGVENQKRTSASIAGKGSISATGILIPAFAGEQVRQASSYRSDLSSRKSSRKIRARVRIRRTLSVNGREPGVLAYPSTNNSVSFEGLEPMAPEEAVQRKTKNTIVPRVLIKRFESKLEKTSVASGEENEMKKESQQRDKPFETTRRSLEKRNPTDLFHVCPLVLHKSLGGGEGRAMHKLVFACPGKAAALVAAMEGVCYFNMRLTQQPGMTVVQRSYNAFAVRVQTKRGKARRAVPVSETKEGDLCIEMRIRLYRDGLMSKQLSHLIKNRDNPAVQLQGPFLQNRVNPPPAYRNVIMIAAGTGVNPMVQLIRDYLKLRSPIEGGRPGSHSRLVLLWQNNVEQDFYCADELTRLQANANGLLEVTALVSGDTTRRNRPGDAFRSAKAKVARRRKKSSNDARAKSAVGGSEGESKHDESKEEKKEDEESMDDLPPRNRSLARDLSRVSEEDSMSRASSSVRSITVLSGSTWDPETGGSGGIDGRDDSSVDDKSPMRFMRFLPRWASASGSMRRLKGDIGNGRNVLGNTSESVDSREDKLDIIRVDDTADDYFEGVDARSTGELTKNKATLDSGPSDQNMEHMPKRETDTSPADIRSNDSLNDASIDRGVSDNCRSSRREGSAVKGNKYLSGVHVASSLSQTSECRSGEMKRRTICLGENTRPSLFTEVDKGKASSERSGKRGRFSMRVPLVKGSQNVSADQSLEEGTVSVGQNLEGETSAAVRPLPRSGPLSSSAISPSRMRSTYRGLAQGRARKNRKAVSKERQTVPPVHHSGAGLVHSKLTKDILRNALGSRMLDLIAMAGASTERVANLNASQATENIADRSEEALHELVGTTNTGGRLQVVVSGPAGFVFYVESLLDELRVPTEVVVLLD